MKAPAAGPRSNGPPHGCTVSRVINLTSEVLHRFDGPTALFTSQNLIAIEALRALRDAGRQAEVALTASDDIPLGEAITPAVSVVAQDARGLGHHAAQLLFSRLDGYEGPARRIVLATSLIVRGSGEIAPPP